MAQVFPILGGNVLTHLSHSHRDFSIFLKNADYFLFFFFILFIAKILPKPNYRESFLFVGQEGFQALLYLVYCPFDSRTNAFAVAGGQVSVAGFDFGACESSRLRQ